MNYKTLTSGSIVNFEDELWGVDVISHTNKKLTLHNLNGDTANQPFYMINPVPITPELLECLKDKFEVAHYGKGDLGITLYLHENKNDDTKWFSFEICENNIELDMQWGDLCLCYNNPPLHLFQHFLRGIEGLDFEITLQQLKDYNYEHK